MSVWSADVLEQENEAFGTDVRSHEALIASLLRSILELLGDKPGD